jgi:hypothetical protein
MATIKHIILLVFTTLIMVGCDNNGKPLGYTYLELDSCEYIASFNQLAHKGNCRFCKERDSIKWEKRKKELEELVINLKEE